MKKTSTTAGAAPRRTPDGAQSHARDGTHGKGSAAPACWCGNRQFDPFNAQYGKCRECGGLVLLDPDAPGRTQVEDDDKDFYGKRYWLEHQKGELGNPDIHLRARNDLTERNLHWIDALLRYKLPPARTLEVGCAHGSFVALMQLAGYSASGSEMSPWVVDFGQRTFGVPILLGPVEDLDVPAASLDAILMMDVLEHLPDPVHTLRRCVELLKADGVLVIQTPQYRVGTSHEQMLRSNDPFLEQLKPEEHLYLFTDSGLRRILDQAGMPHARFEPAIFAHYDMFAVASRAPLPAHTGAMVEHALLATPGGRMALALLDMRRREETLRATLAKANSDVRFLMEKASTADAAQTSAAQQAQAQLSRLQADFAMVESDRVARGEVIEKQGAEIVELQAQVHARLQELTGLYAELEDLRTRTRTLEAEKQEIGHVAAGLHEEIDRLLRELKQLAEQVESARTERDALQAAVTQERDRVQGERDRLVGEFQARERALGELVDSLRLRLEESQLAMATVRGTAWYAIGKRLRLIR